jgi:hypothetical protein
MHLNKIGTHVSRIIAVRPFDAVVRKTMASQVTRSKAETGMFLANTIKRVPA